MSKEGREGYSYPKSAFFIRILSVKIRVPFAVRVQEKIT